MKMKRYVVNSMPEAMQKIRSELGDNAVILNTKEVKLGGFLGFFTQKKIEVTAASDESVESKAPDRKKEQLVTAPAEWMTEMREMKKMIHKLAQSKTSEHSEVLDFFRYRLLSQDFPPMLTDRILEKADASLAETENGSRDDIFKHVRQSIRQQLQAILDKQSVDGISPNRQVVNFIGPTGVGKTTTLAKLAAQQVITHQRKIGFITADTFRIAAIEQLRTYAGILNVPMEVVHSPHDLQQAVERLADCDLIFMDTAGRNYRNEMYVSELNNLLDLQEKSETYLVLSLTMKPADMETVTSQFSKYHLDRILFTKYDETHSVGAIFHLVDTYHLPLSYITFGQNVPDDIEKLDTRKLVEQVMEGLEDE